MRVDRQTILLAFTAMVLLGCVAWSYGYCSAQRDAAAAAAQEAAECRRLAAEVKAAGPAPAGVPRPAEPTRAIAAAAAAARIPPSDLDRIEPGPARRTLDGSAVEKPVDVYVRRATLQQTITFLHALASPPNDLRPTRLRLTTPDPPTPDGWAVEATLTYPTADAAEKSNATLNVEHAQ